jgi:drug/metabolite transporter (DMT)-like permease
MLEERKRDMQPTFYVGIVGVILLALLFRQTRVRSIWWFFAIAQVFGGTSVATLTALGGASLAVSQVGVAALVYAVFAMVAPRDFLALRRTISTHAAGIALIVYAVIISVMGPRLFAGQMNLVAMRPETLNGFIIATPLEPRSSNIAHLAYLVGSFLTALATSLVFCRKLTATDFRNAVLSAGLLHAALGAIDAVSSSLGAGWVLDFLRNANFSFVDQSIGNIKRISGSLAEACCTSLTVAITGMVHECYAILTDN